MRFTGITVFSVYLGDKMRVNLGCGNKYLEYYCNIDCDTSVKADLYIDLETQKPPTNNYTYADNVLEHLSNNGIRNVVEALVEDGVLAGIVPHHLSRHAYNDIEHKTYYNINTFNSIKNTEIISLQVFYCFTDKIKFTLPMWFVRLHERIMPGILPPTHIKFKLKKKTRRDYDEKHIR